MASLARCKSFLKARVFSRYLGQGLTAASTLGFLAFGAFGFFSLEGACITMKHEAEANLPYAGYQTGHSYVDITFLVVAFFTAGFLAAGFFATFLSSSLSL